jgi:hypothetical protein
MRNAGSPGIGRPINWHVAGLIVQSKSTCSIHRLLADRFAGLDQFITDQD